MPDFHLDRGTVVLVIDDDPLFRTAIKRMLEPEDVVVIETETVATTWSLLRDNTAVNLDAILLDRTLPDGDGLSLLPRLRELPGTKHVPVIVMSGLVSPEDVTEGMRHGAYYYLPKPLRSEMLRTVLQVAVREARERRHLLAQMARLSDGLVFMSSASFEIRTIGDAETLTPFLASMFANPESAAIGIAELLINAVEHGNLEIGYELKSRLVVRHAWLREIERRLALPAYRKRTVAVRLERFDDRVEITIRDSGQGFAWQDYQSISEERMFDVHGRGIAMARYMCFDGIEYQGSGNVVRCWSNL